MDPGWLHAVAWTFERWPDTQVLYGARLIEDAPARDSTPSGALPHLDWEAFDRRRLEQGNYIDMNTIAHARRLDGLPLRRDAPLEHRLAAHARPVGAPHAVRAAGGGLPLPHVRPQPHLRRPRPPRAQPAGPGPRPPHPGHAGAVSQRHVPAAVGDLHPRGDAGARGERGRRSPSTRCRCRSSPMAVEQPVSNDLYQAVQDIRSRSRLRVLGDPRCR